MICCIRLGAMKLHEYPGISLVSWIAMSGSQKEQIAYDRSILKSVALSRVHPITICYLYDSTCQCNYMGTQLCKNPNVCSSVYAVLQKNIGKPIAEIGDLEFPENPNNTLIA